MLFVMVAEALTRMVLAAQYQGLIIAFKVKSYSHEIPILQYADDTFMMDAKVEEIDNITAVVLWFEAVAGLDIIIRKTKMFKANDCDNFEDQVTGWGCQWRELPSAYLGLPLAADFKAKEM